MLPSTAGHFILEATEHPLRLVSRCYILSNYHKGATAAWFSKLFSSFTFGGPFFLAAMTDAAAHAAHHFTLAWTDNK